MERRDFLKGMSLSIISITLPETIWGCSKKETPAVQANPEWEKQASAFESLGILTAENQGKWQGKAGSHVPVVSIDKEKATIALVTNHPMSPEHYITAHYVRDQDGKMFGFKNFTGTDKEARSVFTIPKGTKSITAFSHCNIHGLWKAQSKGV